MYFTDRKHSIATRCFDVRSYSTHALCLIQRCSVRAVNSKYHPKSRRVYPVGSVSHGVTLTCPTTVLNGKEIPQGWNSHTNYIHKCNMKLSRFEIIFNGCLLICLYLARRSQSFRSQWRWRKSQKCTWNLTMYFMLKAIHHSNLWIML